MAYITRCISKTKKREKNNNVLTAVIKQSKIGPVLSSGTLLRERFFPCTAVTFTQTSS